MSDKQNKSRIFVVVLVILVVAIIAIGLFFTWLIIKDGEKNKDVSLVEPKQIYVIEQEKTDLTKSVFFKLILIQLFLIHDKFTTNKPSFFNNAS